MKFDPRCLLIDRAHLAKFRATAELKVISRELEEFEQSETAQALMVVITPGGIRRTLITDVDAPRTQPPSVEVISAFIELALQEHLPSGVVGWILGLDEPALSGAQHYLNTRGTLMRTFEPNNRSLN